MKRALIAVICLLVPILVLSACKNNYLQYDEIDTTFEEDYALINDMTEYLVALEESVVIIECDSNRIKGDYGKSMEFQSIEIEKIVDDLAQKGYIRIMKKANIVIFDVWRKPFDVEFESGFAYSIDGTGDLSPQQFLTNQRPLSKERWYYYESDYNEWRINGEYVWEGT